MTPDGNAEKTETEKALPADKLPPMQEQSDPLNASASASGAASNPVDEAKATANASAAIDKQIDQTAAEVDHKAVVADGAAEADASAGSQVDEPVEAEDVPHPAIAEIEGVAASIGHKIDVTDAELHALPLRPVAVDALGRLWAVSERDGEDGDRVTLEFVGRVQR